MLRKARTNTVYSTDDDFVPAHKRPLPATRSLPPKEQTAEIRREKKGRGGKTVTAMLREMVTKLDPREATILRYRFGLDGGTERTLEEVGQEFGVVAFQESVGRQPLAEGLGGLAVHEVPAGSVPH